MIEEVLFGTLVFSACYFVLSKIESYSKSMDYITSSVFSAVLVGFVYGFLRFDIPFLFLMFGPLFATKLVLNDFFKFERGMKLSYFYKNVLTHIFSFFTVGIVFFILAFLDVDNSLNYVVSFVLSIFICILYCFYLISSFNHIDDIPVKKIKRKKVIEFAVHSKNQRDNFSSYPMDPKEIEKHEENSYNHNHDAKMRMLQKEIELKRKKVHKGKK